MSLFKRRERVMLSAVAAVAVAAAVLTGCGGSAVTKVGAGGVASVTPGGKNWGYRWTAKNLNVELPESWCYEDKPENCEKYGRLYTWNAAKTACPAGWELPSRQDWDVLGAAAGGAERIDNNGGIDWYDAGKKLKAREGWFGGGNGDDALGFAALPGGNRSADGSFGDATYIGRWWTSDSDGDEAYHRYMMVDNGHVLEGKSDPRGGMSVRCVESASKNSGGKWITSAKRRSEQAHNEAKTPAEAAANAEHVEEIGCDYECDGDDFSGHEVASEGYLLDYRDGREYKIEKIGKHTWMAQNLNIKTDNSWCYDNKEENCDKYGRLYTWEEAKGICVDGWHLSTRIEWNELSTMAGGEKVAGKKLKAKTGWKDREPEEGGGSGNGTDDYGFAALPAGSGGKHGFEGGGEYATWWTEKEHDQFDAYARSVYYNRDEVVVYRSPQGRENSGRDKKNGFSVRCVQD